MYPAALKHIAEKIRGVAQKITYHNPDNGWSVLRVSPFDARGETATVHQMQASLLKKTAMLKIKISPAYSS